MTTGPKHLIARARSRLKAAAARIFPAVLGRFGPFGPRSPKVFNEHLKQVAGFLNSLAVAFVIVAIVRPLLDPQQAVSYIYGVLGLVFHGLSHYAISKLKEEDR